MIWPHNDQRASLGINPKRLVRMPMARVVALVVSKDLGERCSPLLASSGASQTGTVMLTFHRPLARHRGKELWDLLLLDLLPVRCNHQDTVDHAIRVRPCGREPLGSLLEGLGHL